MDECQGRPGQRGRDDGRDENGQTRSAERLRHEERRDGTHQHHPLDAEVQDAGALGEQLPQARQHERRAEGDGRDRDGDDEIDVHEATSAPASSSMLRSGSGGRPSRIR